MPKRIALRLVNLIWYSTALLIVLAATVVAAGRELLPEIDLDNKALFRYVSEQTGADIQATRLRGTWTQLYPEFTAEQITVNTPVFSLRLDNVHLDVDILRSIWRKTLVFDRLVLSQAYVRYNQPETTADSPPDADKSWRVINLLLNKNIHVRNVTVDWYRGTLLRHLQLQDLRVEQTLLGSKRLFLRLAGPDGEEDLYAVGRLQGESLASSSGELYVKIGEWPLREWLPSPDASQPAMLQTILQQPWHSSGEAWFNWQGKDEAHLHANVALRNTDKTATTQPTELATRFSGQWQRHGGSTIDVHSLQWQAPGQPGLEPLLENLRLRLGQPASWRLQTPAVTLDRLAAVTAQLPADSSLKSLLQALNPRGQLRNVELLWDNSKPLTERMQLRANADNLTTGAWHGVPAFTGVSGYLHSGIGYGYIDLDSRNGFSMHYPDIYHQPMAFRSAAGRVQWQWLPEEKTVLVGSDYATLDGEAGEARGNFWLHLPLPGADFRSEMYLAIGLRNSEAKYRDTFLPYILPQNLLHWLKTSIGEAQVPTAGFIYRGALSGHELQSRAIQFFADVNDASLQFDPAWPTLTALDARLLVDDGQAFVRAYSGQLYNTAMEGAAVHVLPQSKGISVHVNARARGYAQDGLRVLRETPLHKAIGNTMDSWHMPQGLLTAGLQLQIPLGGADVPQQEDVRIALYDTQLRMDELRLQFNAIQGEIRYDHNTGLQAPALAATLFDKPVQVAISSKQDKRGQTTLQIDGQGSANARDIASWSNLQPLQLLAGQFDYRVALTLPPNQQKNDAPLGQLRVNSDLTGVSAPLPAPLAMTAGTRKPLAMTVDLYRDNRQDYRVDFNRQLSGALSMRARQLFGGEISVLGQAAQLPQQAGPLQIRGTLPSADLQQWLDLVAAYNSLPASANASTTPYPTFAFTVNNAVWRDMAFPQLQLSASHETAAWRIYFDSGNARGSAFFHDDPRQAPDIVLSELKISQAPENNTPKTADTAGNIDFAAIPSLNIRIDHLIFNGMDIGTVSTALRTSADALHFEKLLAKGAGYSVYNQQGNDGAQLTWRRDTSGTYHTAFRGLLHMQGPQPVLTHLGYPPFVVGENIYFGFDIAWPGNPDALSMKTVSGQLLVRGEKGKYLQVQPNAAMKVLSVIDITTWVRRLRLDFSDLSNDGISFDRFKGKLVFGNGMMEFAEPLTVESPSSTMALSGKALLEKEELDLQLNATLPVGNNAAWIAAIAGGLPAAAGVYVVSKLFDDQIKSLTSLTYTITGPMSEPDIRFKLLTPQKKP